ncbi:MAG: cysteine hydrolase [Hyphomicrobiaceae bacterium]|nr:cysteine hydrolase [Hyphomicrobiaceae bacterium]
MSAATLLVIDLQRAFCDADGSMARQGRPIEPLQRAALAGNALADAARSAGAGVVWTRMVFAPDYADGGWLVRAIRPNLARVGALRRGSGDELLSRSVTAGPGEAVVDKARFSALVGTDLEVQLRAAGCSRVVVCGVTTSMCVESTVRDLAQRDFETYVVADACADFEERRHRAALESMEFGFARILDSAGARQLFRSGAGL